MRASYCATRLNAVTASAKRVCSESVPCCASSSSSSASYWAGSVATATCAKFLAAARSIAGPPISMFSMMSAKRAFGSAETFSNGYRFSTSRSMATMPCSAMTASSVPRRPSRPPWTLGCRVLTRPSMISGKPVSSETSRTARPASRMAFALPPVDSSSTPRAASARASSIRPVLSETDSNARRTAMRSPAGEGEGEAVIGGSMQGAALGAAAGRGSGQETMPWARSFLRSVARFRPSVAAARLWLPS